MNKINEIIKEVTEDIDAPDMVDIVDLQNVRPVMIGSEIGQEPEFIWMATHREEKYNWFCGLGNGSIEARRNLKKLIDLIEGKI